MSLVNDMLRDLDQRRQSPDRESTLQQISPAANQTAPKGARKWLSALFWSLWIVALVALAVLVYQLRPHWPTAVQPLEKQLVSLGWLAPRAEPSINADSAVKARPAPLSASLSTGLSTDLSTRAADPVAEQAPSSNPVLSEELESSESPASETLQAATNPITENTAQNSPSETIDKTELTTESEPTTAAATSPSQVTGPTVVDVQWQPGEQNVKLVLTLDREPKFQVIERQASELRLALLQSQFDGALPPLPQHWISASRLQTEDGRLMLSVVSETAGRFQIYPLISRKSKRLIIDFRPDKTEIQKPVANKTSIRPAPSTEMDTGSGDELNLAAAAANQPATVESVRKSAETNGSNARSHKPPVIKSRKQLPSTEALDRQQLQAAAKLIRRGRHQQALSDLQQFVTQQPKASGSRQLLASMLIGEGRLKQADMLLQEGLRIDPGHGGLKKNRARILLANQKPDQAADLLRQAPPAMKDDPEYHQIFAAALQGSHQFAEASAVYYQLLRADSTQASWWMGLGISLEALDKAAQARQAYNNVLQIPAADQALKTYAQQRIRQLNR